MKNENAAPVPDEGKNLPVPAEKKHPGPRLQQLKGTNKVFLEGKYGREYEICDLGDEASFDTALRAETNAL